MSAQVDLKDSLRAMGVSKAFSEDADFSNMSASHFKISNVVHQTTLEVTEQGSTAAAATGVAMTRGEGPPNMICNRPFGLSIVHVDQTDTPLFTGLVLNPDFIM